MPSQKRKTQSILRRGRPRKLEGYPPGEYDTPDDFQCPEMWENDQRFQDIWQTTLHRLHQSRLLKQSYYDTIVMYCEAYYAYRELYEKWRAQGFSLYVKNKKGQMTPSSYRTATNQECLRAVKIGSLLGMNPTSEQTKGYGKNGVKAGNPYKQWTQ